MKWYENNNATHDVVISSRVRLARNLADYPFVAKADEASSEKVASVVKKALEDNYGEKLICTDMATCKNKNLLVEDHLISPDFCATNGMKKLLITDENEHLAVMVGEEDHVRIQAIYSGLALEKAYETAEKADDALAKGTSVAFDENLGYLTACPTNLGTGLRASVMLHLPAMSMYGYMKNLASLMTKIGLTVRGMYGEGSDSVSCMYQLSNQVTLGISEKDTLEKLQGAVKQIVEKERELRGQLIARDDALTDTVYRSYGTLKYARKMDTKEATRLISNVLLGKNCGLLKNSKVNYTRLLFHVFPAHIADAFPDATTAEKRDIARASFVRDALAHDEI